MVATRVHIPLLAEACNDYIRTLTNPATDNNLANHFYNRANGVSVQFLGIVSTTKINGSCIVIGRGQVAINYYNDLYLYQGEWNCGEMKFYSFSRRKFSVYGDRVVVNDGAIPDRETVCLSSPDDPELTDHIGIKEGNLLLKLPLVPEARYILETPDELGLSVELSEKTKNSILLIPGFPIESLTRDMVVYSENQWIQGSLYYSLDRASIEWSNVAGDRHIGDTQVEKKLVEEWLLGKRGISILKALKVKPPSPEKVHRIPQFAPVPYSSFSTQTPCGVPVPISVQVPIDCGTYVTMPVPIGGFCGLPQLHAPPVGSPGVGPRIAIARQTSPVRGSQQAMPEPQAPAVPCPVPCLEDIRKAMNYQKK